MVKDIFGGPPVLWKNKVQDKQDGIVETVSPSRFKNNFCLCVGVQMNWLFVIVIVSLVLVFFTITTTTLFRDSSVQQNSVSYELLFKLLDEIGPREHNLRGMTARFFESSIPFYCINLNRSTDRWDRMKLIGNKILKDNLTNTSSSVPLVRVEAVNGFDREELLRHWDIEEYTVAEARYECSRVGNVFHELVTLNEIAVTLSHLITYRQAYLDGVNMALVVEDDVSFHLVPLWTESLESLVEEYIPVEHRDTWTMIRLQYFVNPEAINKWKADPERRLIMGYSGDGMTAQLIHRRGLEAMMNTFASDSVWTNGKDFKFNLFKKKVQTKCISDHVLPAEMNLAGPVMLATPVKFSPSYIVTTTGPRCNSMEGCKMADTHRDYHMHNLMNSLKWSIEAKRIRN